jgi:hypothetical protein
MPSISDIREGIEVRRTSRKDLEEYFLAVGVPPDLATQFAFDFLRMDFEQAWSKVGLYMLQSGIAEPVKALGPGSEIARSSAVDAEYVDAPEPPQEITRSYDADMRPPPRGWFRDFFDGLFGKAKRAREQASQTWNSADTVYAKMGRANADAAEELILQNSELADEVIPEVRDAAKKVGAQARKGARVAAAAAVAAGERIASGTRTAATAAAIGAGVATVAAGATMTAVGAGTAKMIDKTADVAKETTRKMQDAWDRYNATPSTPVGSVQMPSAASNTPRKSFDLNKAFARVGNSSDALMQGTRYTIPPSATPTRGVTAQDLKDLGNSIAQGVSAGASNVGRGIGAGARGVGRGMSNAGNAAGSAIVGTMGRLDGRGIGIWILLILSVLWHLATYLFFKFSSGMLILQAFVLAIFCLIYALFIDRNDARNFIYCCIGSLILYALTTYSASIGQYLPDKWIAVLLFATIGFPLHCIYLLMKLRNEYGSGFAKLLLVLYVILLVLIFIGFSLAAVMEASDLITLPNGGRVDVKQGLIDFWDLVKDRWETGWKGVTTTIDKATSPGEYYTGQVEENKKKPLGVSIDMLRPVEPNVNNESDIVVFGSVTAKSFIKESIHVIPTCIIDKKNAPASRVEPIQMEVLFGPGQSFECTFPTPQELWAKGSYPVTASAQFPFETWAYIPYTFVDEERIRNFARQGIDVKQALDIADQPTAIYTSGPVTIGMGGSSMPIAIKTDGDQMISPGTRIGVTVDSAWQGKLKRVTSIEIKVPEPFALKGCDRPLKNDPELDMKDPLYTNYLFENPDQNTLSTYSTITCQLDIDPAKRDDAIKLVSSADKTERSFIAVVDYDFVIEKKTTVNVK